MKLHSPAFEKALRRGVRQAVRSSAELKREYRAARRVQGNPYINGVVKYWWVFFIGGLIAAAVNKRENIEFGLAIISLLGAVFMFYQSLQLLNRLFHAPDITALVLLPVAEERIFKWGLWQFIRRSLPTLFIYAVSFVALAGHQDLSPGCGVLVPVFIGLNWAGVIALSIIFAAIVPRKISAFGLILASLSLAVFLFVVLKDPFWAKFFDSICWPLAILLPAGWPAVLFSSLLEGWNWKYWGFVGLLGGIFLGVRPALARLQAHYELVEVTPVEVSDLVPGEASSGVVGHPSDSGVHVGETEIADIVGTRRFLAYPAWQNRGWFELLLWRWFTPREHALCEFTFPMGVFIFSAWRRVFRNLLVVFGGLLLAKWIFAGTLAFGILAAVGMLIPWLQAWGQLYSQGRAFTGVFSSGYKLPRHACQGVGYAELSRLLFKCAVVQTPFFMGASLLVGLMVAVLFTLPLTLCAGLAVKVCLAVTISRAFFVVLAFSELSTDSFLRLRWRLWFYGGILLAALFLYIGAVLAMVFIPDPLWSLLFGLLALGTAGVCWWLYGRLYQGNNFDLMKASP